MEAVLRPPPCFRCPISQEVMTDPVSLSTGISYDRSSIERWLQDHNTCPSTSEELRCKDLTPNHTLRRLISHWRALNRKLGQDPAPKTGDFRDFLKPGDDPSSRTGDFHGPRLKTDPSPRAGDFHAPRPKAGARTGDFHGPLPRTGDFRKPEDRMGDFWSPKPRTGDFRDNVRELDGDGVERERVWRLIDTAQHEAAGGEEQLVALRELRSLARESGRSSRVIGESENAVAALALIISSRRAGRRCREEAVAVLVLAPMSACKRRILAEDPIFVAAVCWILRRGGASQESRANAATLLEILAAGERDLKILVGAAENAFPGLVELLLQARSAGARTAALRTLMSLCSPRRNRVKAVESGAAEALVEILPGVTDRSVCENALAVLEIVCGCAEGRAAVSEMEAGVSAVCSRILAVSEVSTECAVRILWGICRHSVEERLQRRLVEAGVVERLVLMLQMDFSSGTKHKMGDLLKLLSNIQLHCPDVAAQDRIHLCS